MIDAAEFVGPGTDIALGLYRVAPFYYYPGFNKPNGTGECIVSLNAWNALDAELKSIVAHACAVGSQLRAGRDGAAQHRGAGGADRPAPRAVARVPAGPDRRRARRSAATCWASSAARSAVARKVHDSYVAFRERAGAWSRISIKAVLEAREG